MRGIGSLKLQRKCIRKGDGGCIVPNIVKTPNRCYIEPFDEKEENTKDDFNMSVLKQYFINSNMLVEDSKIADVALENILNDNDFKNFCEQKAIWIINPECEELQ